jgi:hypothetical protein
MATLEQLSAALVKADAAGNAADAKALADAIRQMRTAPQPAALQTMQPSAVQVSPDAIPGTRQELTTGQRVYQAVRPYVAPSLEALGAAGGAVLGTPFGGPVGAIAGAGAGYATAKGALKAADVAMGVEPPETLGGAIARTAKDVLEGATFEVGGRVLGPVIGKVAGKIADLRNIPANKAANLARASLGPDLEQTLNALKSAPPNTSVAEITAKIQNPAWQALVRDALEKSPSGAQYLNKLATMSDQEGANALAKLVGGITAAEARGTAEMAKKNLGAITGPMRESSLARANLGKFVADDAALREANDLATMVGSGGQIDPVRFAAQATGAEKALRSVGIKPLEGAPLAQRIEAVAQDSKFAANDLIEGSAKQIADDITKWTNNGGVIDANALEAIRKNSVNAAIAKLRPGMDATSQRNAAAGVLSRIKPLIDDAIESAGGTGWRDYLTTHAKGMQKITEKQLTGEAQRLFKTDKDAFVRLVQNESPEVVEKFLGPGKYNIATELTENTLSTLQSLADKRLAQLAASKQASDGEKALTTLLRENTSKFRLPSWLSFWGAAANKTISELEKAVGGKSMKVLAEAMQSPEGAANLLERLPAEERSRVLKLISDPSQWSSTGKTIVRGTTAAGVNALAPDRDSTNALASQPVRVLETQ